MAKLAGTTTTRPVVIIGAGIQGCATAFFLSQRGQPVIVLEKDHVGRHASGVNAGGVRRLGRDIAEIPLSVASMEWWNQICLLYTSPSPRDLSTSRMPSSA